eukprot:jgi/Hompol1/3466/HPOL_006550-RA
MDLDAADVLASLRSTPSYAATPAEQGTFQTTSSPHVGDKILVQSHDSTNLDCVRMASHSLMSLGTMMDADAGDTSS